MWFAISQQVSAVPRKPVMSSPSIIKTQLRAVRMFVQPSPLCFVDEFAQGVAVLFGVLGLT